MSKGRPNKKGLEFFSLEVNFISDIKIRKLIKYQSGGAVTVYVHLLCNIYENGYYIVWDNELPFIISESTGFDEAYISEVIKCCMNVGLIDKNMFENHKILTSIGIQIRYNEICKRANRTSRVEEFSLLNTKEEKVINSEQKALPYEENAICYNENAINSELTTQSKVKERKVKERKEIQQPFMPPSKIDVTAFFVANGFPEALGVKAFDYYSPEWVDSNGKKVKNWKLKMKSVWFTEENKQNSAGNKKSAFSFL